MIKLGITGELGSGKTTIRKMFSHLADAKSFDADTVAKRVYSPDHPLYSSIANLLKEKSPEMEEDLKERKPIDPKEVANLLFNDEKLLSKVETIIHPYVYQELEKEMKKAEKEGRKYFIAEIPLLFETHKESLFDGIILVEAPEEKKKIWKEKRDIEENEGRKKRFLPLREKREKANFVVINKGSMQQLQTQVSNIIASISA